MWADYLMGTPVWPLRDMIYCSIGLPVGLMAINGLAYLDHRRRAA
jgi:hypothetical protein